MADSYKLRIYEILEATRSHDDAAEAVNLFLHVLVILNIASVVLETVDGVYLAHREFFQLFADISVAIFTVEYLLRLWSCDVDPKYARSFRTKPGLIPALSKAGYSLYLSIGICTHGDHTRSSG